MQISKIAAHVRFSKDIGGSWKSLELAAEADVTIMDDWTVCQAELYSQLSQQLRQLWNNGNGTALNSANGAESPVEPPSEPAPVWVGNSIRILVRNPRNGLHPEEWQGWRVVVEPQGAGG